MIHGQSLSEVENWMPSSVYARSTCPPPQYCMVAQDCGLFKLHMEEMVNFYSVMFDTGIVFNV